MKIFDYDIPINNYYLKLVIIFIILFFICFMVISYYVLKFLKTSLEEYNIFFYDYNKKTKKMLDKYGNYKITKLYLVRQPFGKIMTNLLNIFTCYQFNKLINETPSNLPYHSFIIFEIKTGKNKRKLIMLEKHNFINICDNFLIRSTQEVKNINIKNNKYTINSILNATQKRLGNEVFFNWHHCKNNCHNFTKELLITFQKYNKIHEKYIFRNKLLKIINPSELTLHMAYCLSFGYNILSKYIFDSDVLN